MTPVKDDMPDMAGAKDEDVVSGDVPTLADNATWNEFFDATFERVVNIVLVWTHDRAEAEDAASHAMTVVWQRWSDLTNPEGYAYRAALHFWRRQRRRRAETAALPEDDNQAVGYDDPALTAYEIDQWFRQKVSQLPPSQREALVYAFDGLSAHEIADVLGTNRDVVYQRLYAARQRLQAMHATEFSDFPIPRPRKDGR